MLCGKLGLENKADIEINHELRRKLLGEDALAVGQKAVIGDLMAGRTRGRQPINTSAETRGGAFDALEFKTKVRCPKGSAERSDVFDHADSRGPKNEESNQDVETVGDLVE